MADSGQIGITFLSEGYQLLGTLFLARGFEPKPTVLILHGIPGIEKNFDLAHALREIGWNSLIFHYRGCWGSQGPYRVETIPRDVKAAVDFLDSGKIHEVEREKLFLVGHSLGGWAALLSATSDPRIQGVAVYSPVTDPRSLTFSRSMVADEFIPWVIGTEPHTFATEWRNLPDKLIPIEQVSKISPRPLMIIYSEVDEVVPYNQSQILYDYAKHPKNITSHTKANHSFTWHRPWLRSKIIGWLIDQQ